MGLFGFGMIVRFQYGIIDSWILSYITFSVRLVIGIFCVIKKESNMSFLKTLSSIEKFILGEKKPKDHWKQYRKEK